MDYKKEAIKQNAEELFANYFVKGMKNKDIVSFKRDYKTLYTNVIIPMAEFLIEKQIKLHQPAVIISVCEHEGDRIFNEDNGSEWCCDCKKYISKQNER